MKCARLGSFTDRPASQTDSDETCDLVQQWSTRLVLRLLIFFLVLFFFLILFFLSTGNINTRPTVRRVRVQLIALVNCNNIPRSKNESEQLAPIPATFRTFLVTLFGCHLTVASIEQLTSLPKRLFGTSWGQQESIRGLIFILCIRGNPIGPITSRYERLIDHKLILSSLKLVLSPLLDYRFVLRVSPPSSIRSLRQLNCIHH